MRKGLSGRVWFGYAGGLRAEEVARREIGATNVTIARK